MSVFLMEANIKRLIRCPEAVRPNWTFRELVERSAREMDALSVTEKAPERSGKPTRVYLRKQIALLVWGPGAGVEAAGRLWSGRNRPGVASIPQSCRQGCDGDSYFKQSSMAHVKAQDAARQNGDVREPSQDGERAPPPELTKAPPVTGQRDGCGSLGQVVGAQGVLVQPE